MSTFSKQDGLPNLPVPPLKQTLEKYVKSASALLSPGELTKLREEVLKFENSSLAEQLQKALENRAQLHKNWLEDWWYNVYTEGRYPLIPFVSFGALNSAYKPIDGGQLSRAADVLHHWLSVWDKIRHEKWPITSSRGVTWDMIQFHQLFSSNRTPHIPNDSMDRFFKTKAQGVAPHHVVVNCNGSLWKVEVLNSDDTVKSADQLYAMLKFIKANSIDQKKYCIAKLTTTDRDTWSKNRDELTRVSARNLENLRDIETSILVMTLADSVPGDQTSMMKKMLLDESWMTWQDKSVSITAYKDGQIAIQGDHSNIDAIVLLQVGDYVGERVRKDLWHPTELEKFESPLRLDFELNEHLRHELSLADVAFYKNTKLYRARPVHYSAYGNDLCRNAKVYTDTVVQLALQLAYVRTHGLFAPIYETASTRKFYHGRTETVRGCTAEFVKFAKVLLGEVKEEGTSQKELFDAAIDAHNRLMADCMEGNGFDRHLLGLRKTLEIMNKGCGPSWSVPEFMQNETWRRLGGDGNFLLSTSFIGYMNGHDVGTFGYVAAMRPDGYGCFYRIGKERISVAVSDWAGTRSNIDAFAANIVWALDRLQQFLTKSKM